MLITPDMIKKHNPCEKQFKRFRKAYPDGIEATQENIYKLGKEGYNVEWGCEVFKLTAHIVTYCSNGQKWRDCYYKDGLLDGHCQSWHENGQKWRDCYYKDGVIIG